MKVLLVRPPAYRHLTENSRSLAPYGLCMVAAAIRERHSVQVLDAEVGNHTIRHGGGFFRCGMSDAEIREAVRAAAPDVIGISCMFANALPALVRVSELAREEAPSAVLVAGGYAASTDASRVLPHVDHVICGEGEFAFPLFLEELERGVRPPEITLQKWERNLNVFPFPAYDLIDLNDYRKSELAPVGLPSSGNHQLAAGLMASRGCPVGCNFCSVQFVTGVPFRKASVSHVVDQVIRLRDEFGVTKIHFFDDNLTLNRNHALALFQELIDREAGVEWNTTQGTAAWNWDDEMLDLAVESGLQYLIIPVESGDPKVLKEIMHKAPLGKFDMHGLIRRARGKGIGMQGWAIIGNPGETKENIETTLRYMNELDIDFRGVATATPYPGTNLYRDCKENDYITTPVDFSKLQRCVSIITTGEWTANWVTARAAAWVYNGRRRTGTSRLKATKRCFDAHGARITARMLWLAWIERRRRQQNPREKYWLPSAEPSLPAEALDSVMPLRPARASRNSSGKAQQVSIR